MLLTGCQHLLGRCHGDELHTLAGLEAAGTKDKADLSSAAGELIGQSYAHAP